MFSSVIAAAHLRVYVNGVLLGYVTGVQVAVDTDYREAREIDSNVARELMPGQYRVSATLQVLRGRDTGGLEGAGMAATAQKMLLQKYLTVELVDRLTYQTVYRLTGCEVTRQAWSVAPKQLVTGIVTLIGTLHDNEAQG